MKRTENHLALEEQAALLLMRLNEMNLQYVRSTRCRHLFRNGDVRIFIPKKLLKPKKI